MDLQDPKRDGSWYMALSVRNFIISCKIAFADVILFMRIE